MKKKIVIYLLAAAMVFQGMPVMAAVQSTEEVQEIVEEGVTPEENQDAYIAEEGLIQEEGADITVQEENGVSSEKRNSSNKDADKDLDYILGRPMTDEEIAEQEAMEPELSELPPEEIEAEPILDKIDDGVYTRDSAPSYYDLRQSNLITSVKDQGGTNMCWTYATIAAAEASIVANSKANTVGNTDYSEEHLAYFTYNSVDDPLGNTAGDSTMFAKSNKTYKSAGGNPSMAAMTLSQWKGAAVEGTSTEAASAYSDDAILTDYYNVAVKPDEMKAAIQKYGPLAVTIYYDAAYLKRDTSAYRYYKKPDATNHAVTIIGWDDNYAATNFETNSNVTSAGAWIAKNSYGEDWGDDGYFYISYEEPSFGSAIAINTVSPDTYDHNYQYDGTAGVGYQLTLSQGGSAANIYQAKGNSGGYEKLEAVGFHTAAVLKSFKIDIYTNLSDLSNPTSGKLSYTSNNETVNYMGYHTIPLKKSVMLEQGKYYSIVLTALQDKTGITIERSYSSYSDKVVHTDATKVYTYTAAIQEQQSFSGSAGSWKDLATYYSEPYCFRIKGYTTDASFKSYKITYKLNGGTNHKSNPATFKNSKAIALKNPTRKGYIFAGWYTDSKFKTKISTIPQYASKSYTLYAKWTKVSVGKGKTPVLKNTKAKYMKVTYGAVSGAKGYQIVYSTSSKFSKQKYVYVTGRSKNLSGMKKGTTYYVKVRAYKLDSTGKKVYGSYSNVRKLKITK